MSNINLKKLLPFFIVAIFAVFAGCQSDSTTNPVGGNNNNQDARLTVTATTAAQQTDNAVLVLNEVKMMVKHLEIEKKDMNGEMEEVKTGPIIMYFNMQPPLIDVAASDVAPVTYHRAKFLIHKLQGNETPADPEFGNGSERYSVIIKGTYDGMPFVYKSAVTIVHEIDMTNLLTVDAAENTNATLQIAPYLWFDMNGTMLNPFDPAHQKEIDKNIKSNLTGQTYKFFEDSDRNGVAD